VTVVMMGEMILDDCDEKSEKNDWVYKYRYQGINTITVITKILLDIGYY